MPWELRYPQPAYHLDITAALCSCFNPHSCIYKHWFRNCQLSFLFSADAICTVSRRGAPEEERGGAHCDPPRDRRHQQPHARLPGAVLRRHRRDQVGSARADQRQGVRVEGGRQGRDHPRGRCHCSDARSASCLTYGDL